MWAYLVGLAAAAVGVAVLLALYDPELGPLWVVAALAVVGAAAERSSVRLSNTVEVSISVLPTLFAAVAIGPLAALIVSAASMLGELRPPYMKWAIYTSTRAINGAATGLIASAITAGVPSEIGGIVVATGAAALAGQLLDVSFAAITVRLRRSGSGIAVLTTFLPVLPTSALLYSAVVAPLVIAYKELSPWAVLLFLFPALAAQRLFAMYQDQRRLATDLATANQSLERANLSFASALVTTLDARDRYTAGHSAAVAVYARDIAAGLKLSQDTQQLAHLSGLLHDIGKIGVPPGILEKNGPLTVHERRKMEEHSVTGERILANVEAYAEIAQIVRHHHERVDGQGYPDGLLEKDIPLISRIICVADAYNAMTSDRPYRDAMQPSMARARLVESAGTQFDASVVRVFDEILEHASDTYSSGARADFAVEAQAHPALSGGSKASAAA